jgi:hypothetical protein
VLQLGHVATAPRHRCPCWLPPHAGTGRYAWFYLGFLDMFCFACRGFVKLFKRFLFLQDLRRVRWKFYARGSLVVVLQRNFVSHANSGMVLCQLSVSMMQCCIHIHRLKSRCFLINGSVLCPQSSSQISVLPNHKNPLYTACHM